MSEKLAQCFNTAAQDSDLGYFSQESKALPLSHCTVHSVIPIYFGAMTSWFFPIIYRHRQHALLDVIPTD